MNVEILFVFPVWTNAGRSRGSGERELRTSCFLTFKVLFCPLGLLFPAASGGAAGGKLELLDCQLGYTSKARSLPPDWLNSINHLH